MYPPTQVARNSFDGALHHVYLVQKLTFSTNTDLAVERLTLKLRYASWALPPVDLTPYNNNNYRSTTERGGRYSIQNTSGMSQSGIGERGKKIGTGACTRVVVEQTQSG